MLNPPFPCEGGRVGDGGNGNYAVRLTVTAIEMAVMVAMMTHLVPVTGIAMMRSVMKAAIAMIEALRLGGGHGQAQC